MSAGSKLCRFTQRDHHIAIDEKKMIFISKLNEEACMKAA
jgi:hypothetical protein